MAQGKPKSITKLMKQHPTKEEEEAVTKLLQGKADPIAAACLGLASVERELEVLLRKQLKRTDDATWESMTEIIGPLGSFYQKALMGYAMKLYDADLLFNLHIIRRVRNAFAHSKRLITYEDPAVAPELRSVKIPKKGFFHDYLKTTRARQATTQTDYLAICIYAETELIKRATRGSIAANRNRQRAMQRRYAQALGAGGLGSLAAFAPEGLGPGLLGIFPKKQP